MALVFTNTKERARELTKALRNRGLKVAEIHGGIQPRERKRTMQQINTWTINMSWPLIWPHVDDIPGVFINGDGIPTDLNSSCTVLAVLVETVWKERPLRFTIQMKKNACKRSKMGVTF